MADQPPSRHGRPGIHRRGLPALAARPGVLLLGLQYAGIPDVAVRESRERIKSALINSGFGYPNKRITINLAPANVRKEGAGFDLPVALGILGAMGAVRSDEYLSTGELSLDGTVRAVRGALPIAGCARGKGIANLIVPMENAAEAGVVEGARVAEVRW